jgi:large conductance mechanosensitive channel
MLKEFREFILRGNVLDLAVAVVIGAAFTAIVNSLVEDIITPVIGILMGGVDFSSLSVQVGDAVIAYGKFLQAIFNFLIIGFVLFVVIRSVNRLQRRIFRSTQEEETPTPIPPEIALLTEIRDLLKIRQG